VLDESFVKTSVNKEDLSNVDEEVIHNNLNLFVSFRPNTRHFLESLSQHYELIFWSSYQSEYTKELARILDPQARYFQHILDSSHCQVSTDGTLYIKNLAILTENRKLEDIIILDC